MPPEILTPSSLLAVAGSVLGLGFLSGFRLYLTVLLIGLAMHFHVFGLGPEWAQLEVLGDWRILVAAGLLAIIEFTADKIPWLDSAWDSVHTFIRPIAATLLAATALGKWDPVTRTLLSLLAGTVALSAHSAKAATRLAVNHSPEPFSNIGLSLAGDLALPALWWAVIHYPTFFLAGLAIFLAIFAWFAPKVYRWMRVELAALGAMLRYWLELDSGLWAAVPATIEPRSPAAELWNLLNGRWAATTPEPKLRAVASTLPGLEGSLGYLSVAGGEVRFNTRRLWRTRRQQATLAMIAAADWRSGLFADTLTIRFREGHSWRFDVLKKKRVAPRQASVAALSS
jgi:hypothetical protein